MNLIDHAAELIRASEQRASHAEEKAEKVSAKAAEAVRTAQLRIEQTQAHARLVEQHSAEQVKLAHERIAKAEALAHERVEQAQASAQEGIERAQAAESRLAQRRRGPAMQRNVWSSLIKPSDASCRPLHLQVLSRIRLGALTRHANTPT